MTKTINQTFYYTLSNFLRSASSILMLPIYTRWLTPADYGTVELMTMLLDLTGLIVCNKIGESIYRYYKLAKTDFRKKTVMSTSFLIGAGLNFIGFILLLSFSGYLAPMVSDQENFTLVFIMFSFTIVLESLIATPLIYLKIIEKAKFYMFINVARLILQICLNILFVIYYDLHVTGVVLSSFISSLVIGIILSFILIKGNGIVFSKAIAKKIMKFSVPMIFVSVSSFAIFFGDRFFLKAYASLTDVGIYSLSYRLAFAFSSLFWIPFYQYWQVRRYDVYKDVNADSIFSQTFRRVNAYVLFFLMGYSLALPIFIDVMTSNSFSEAALYAPILTASLVLHMWFEFFSFSLFVKDRTWLLAKIEISSAIISLILYWALISNYHIKGAVAATILSYMFRLVLIYNIGKNVYKINVDIFKSVIALSYCSLVILSFQFTHENIYISFSINSLLTLFTLSIMLTKFLGKQDMRLANNIISKKLKTLFKKLK